MLCVFTDVFVTKNGKHGCREFSGAQDVLAMQATCMKGVGIVNCETQI